MEAEEAEEAEAGKDATQAHARTPTDAHARTEILHAAHRIAARTHTLSHTHTVSAPDEPAASLRETITCRDCSSEFSVRVREGKRTSFPTRCVACRAARKMRGEQVTATTAASIQRN
jgi:hypothetical protein